MTAKYNKKGLNTSSDYYAHRGGVCASQLKKSTLERTTIEAQMRGEIPINSVSVAKEIQAKKPIHSISVAKEIQVKKPIKVTSKLNDKAQDCIGFDMTLILIPCVVVFLIIVIFNS
jgi:hypothetical protein